MRTPVSWFEFLAACVGLLLGFFLLRLLNQVIARISFAWADQQHPVRFILRRLQVIYEPAALLIVAAVFFLVRPISNGLILLLIILATFSHIRNYFSGILLTLQDSLAVGKYIRMDEVQGRVAKMGRLGLRLQTNEGRHYIDYTKLLAQGYALLAGEEIGGLYRMRISLREPEPQARLDPKAFMELLATAPYPEWTHSPEILRGSVGNHSLETRVLLREEHHLFELTRLIGEWGYQCEILREA